MPIHQLDRAVVSPHIATVVSDAAMYAPMHAVVLRITSAASKQIGNWCCNGVTEPDNIHVTAT